MHNHEPMSMLERLTADLDELFRRLGMSSKVDCAWLMSCRKLDPQHQIVIRIVVMLGCWLVGLQRAGDGFLNSPRRQSFWKFSIE